MILYIIFGFLFILGIIGCIVYEHSDLDFLEYFGPFLVIFNCLVLLVFILVSILVNTNVPAKKLELEAEREVIIYQLENKTWENDNNIGAHEVFSDVSEFNKAILGGRERKANPWTSWLYSPVWDLVEPIDINGVSFGE